MSKRLVALVVSSMLGLLVACSGERSAAPSAIEAPRHPGGSGSAAVTFRPDVRVVEQRDGVDALISVSTDGSTLVFDRRRGRIPVIKDGEVLLIKGLLARRVVTSITKGDEFAVLTAPVALVDVVSDAKIHVQAPIRFGKAQRRPVSSPERVAWERVADMVMPPAYAQDHENDAASPAKEGGASDAYGNHAHAPYTMTLNGWETSFSAEPADGRLNLALQLKKSLAGVSAVISGEGYLGDFDFSSDIDVARGTLEKMQMAYRQLAGAMDFRWAVQTTEGGKLRGNSRLKLPAAIEIPLYQYVAGLPLFLEVSTAVIIKPALGAQYEFGRGAFRISYNGFQSFGVQGGKVDADGEVNGDIELLESEGGSGAPIGMVLAFAAPRIELSLGVSKVFKFDGMAEAAELADQYFDTLVTKAFGVASLEKFRNSALGKITATGVLDAAMGSDAAAYIELVTSSGMSHTGTAVMVPCTRTDVTVLAKVGVSAHALGQTVGESDKEIFRKDMSRVHPSGNKLCTRL